MRGHVRVGVSFGCEGGRQGRGYLGVLLADVRQQLLYEPTDPLTRRVYPRYQLRDHLPTTRHYFSSSSTYTRQMVPMDQG